MEVPQKLKIELLYDSAIPLLGNLSEENENTNLKIYMQPNVCGTTIYKSHDIEATRQMDKDGEKWWWWCVCVHTDKRILLSHKGNENLPFATTWVNIGDIVLSKISQTEVDRYCMACIYVALKTKQMSGNNKTEIESWVIKGINRWLSERRMMDGWEKLVKEIEE